MRNRLFAPLLPAILLTAALSLAPAEAGGRLEEHRIPGPSLQGNLLDAPTTRRAQVYLPPSYDTAPSRRYPTLYVLHGIYDSSDTWTRPWNDHHPGYATMQDLMDAGIREQRLQEMVVVILDADKVCHYTDSPVRGNWERFVTVDLVAYVDARFRTVAAAAGRGITGHSMGGHGALKIAMKHPDVFGTAYGLSPSLLGWGGDLAADNPVLLDLEGVNGPEDLAKKHFYVQAVAAVSQCFSPSPGSALLADMPFGVEGGKVVRQEPGYRRWQSQMPVHMVRQYLDNLKRLRAIRFDAGYADQYSHIPLTARELSLELTELGIAHTFELYNGDHRNRLWGRQGRLYTEVLPFFSVNLKEAARFAGRSDP